MEPFTGRFSKIGNKIFLEVNDNVLNRTFGAQIKNGKITNLKETWTRGGKIQFLKVPEGKYRAELIEFMESKIQEAGFAPKTKSDYVWLPTYPKSALAIGKLCAVEYVSKRDGQKYRHVFGSQADRPLLASSLDGQQLLILGGGFRVTDRGIENS